MEFTGERPTEQSGADGSFMRYHSVLPWCRDKIVLDYGCGIGLGSKYLSPYCKSVIGYEICAEARLEAIEKYNSHNITYVASIKGIEADVCCMVEVIEHIEKPQLHQLLEELKYPLVGTTPNGNLFPYHPMTVAERRGFHVWHYTYQELHDLLSKFHSYVEIYGAIWDPKIGAFTSLNFAAYP